MAMVRNVKILLGQTLNYFVYNSGILCVILCKLFNLLNNARKACGLIPSRTYCYNLNQEFMTLIDDVTMEIQNKS
jgi:hypothetical protein